MWKYEGTRHFGFFLWSDKLVVLKIKSKKVVEFDSFIKLINTSIYRNRENMDISHVTNMLQLSIYLSIYLSFYLYIHLGTYYRRNVNISESSYHKHTVTIRPSTSILENTWIMDIHQKLIVKLFLYIYLRIYLPISSLCLSIYQYIYLSMHLCTY